MIYLPVDWKFNVVISISIISIVDLIILMDDQNVTPIVKATNKNALSSRPLSDYLRLFILIPSKSKVQIIGITKKKRRIFGFEV